MYELILFDAVTGSQILHARRGEYTGNEIPIVSELHEFGIDSEKDYKADVIVDSLFSERTNASVLFSKFLSFVIFPNYALFLSTPL